MAVEVHCTPDGDGYRCAVKVLSEGSPTSYMVRVSRSEMERWARGRSAEQLVETSFDFLLERESKESILRDFDLSVIKRYFPEYDG